MTIECSTCHQSIMDGEPANTGEWVGEIATYYHANPSHCVAATARRCAEIVTDSMRHYEDEECTGTMRVALNCIARTISTEFKPEPTTQPLRRNGKEGGV